MSRCLIDASEISYLPMCECGWRGLPERSRLDALKSARAHEQRAHFGTRQTAKQLEQYARRHAAPSVE